MASGPSTTPTSTSTSEAPKLVKKASISEVKTPITPTQTSFGCSHIKSLLTGARVQAVDGYSKAIRSLQKEGNVADRLVKKAGGVSARCEVTYLCLQCPNVNSVRERHRDNHNFAIESANGFVYCFECKDFVYDPTFEEIRSGNNKKRKYKSSFQDGDKKLMSTNATATSCAATGLRGLYNMGATCFMSVVLQSLIHNPFIRTFYLSEGHRSTDCERDACTSCALDDIFTDFYGYEKHEGYGPVHMLQGCWKGGGSLAGYSQQDAHEYLGFILNSLHEAIIDDDDEKPAHKKDDLNCSCVIHQTFGGTLKSTVSCASCRNTTTTIDPFMDLSLDINQAAFTIKKKKLPLTNGTQTVQTVIPVNLVDCLDRFTTAETLSDGTYHCRKCDTTRAAMKKLSLTQLPPVIPIHLKRFSHTKTSAQSNKISTKVRFPLVLDMSPYLSPAPPKSGLAATAGDGSKSGEKDKAKEKERDGDKEKEKEKDKANGEKKSPVKKSGPPDDEADEDTINVRTPNRKLQLQQQAATAGDEGGAEPQWPVYELSSVVVHKGKIDNGHYISYSKQEREWFRFDDSMVVQVNEKEVLNAEAYMLFYVVREF